MKDLENIIYVGRDFKLYYDRNTDKFVVNDKIISSNIKDIEYNKEDGLLIIHKFTADTEDDKVVMVPISDESSVVSQEPSSKINEVKLLNKINEAIDVANKCIEELHKIQDQTNNNTNDIKALNKKISE